MKNFLFAFALLLGSAGCFNPDLTGVTFKCDPAQPSPCPDGQECSSQGSCVPTSSGQNQNPDLAGTAPLTLVSAEGCPLVNNMPGQGYLVSASGKPKVYACPVKFSNSQGMTADVQCKAPFTLCANANNVDLLACTKAGEPVSGFFIANVEANRKYQSNQASCGAPGGGSATLWAGCGRAATAINCNGFAAALECKPFTNFSCNGTKIGDAINGDGASGVLCCAP